MKSNVKKIKLGVDIIPPECYNTFRSRCFGSVGRAHRSHRWGHWFESSKHHHFLSNAEDFFGALAQLVARLNGIQKVRGSTPLCSTKTTQLCGFFCCLYTVFHLFPQVPTHCEYRLPYRKLSSVLASALNFTSYTIIKNQALCVMQLLSASKAHSKRLIFLSNN